MNLLATETVQYTPHLFLTFRGDMLLRKLSDANHAIKCCRTHLENLVQNNPSYKGRGKLTENMRKRLTKAARSAIIMRSKEPDTRKAIRKLQHDLMNGPLHCFGYHTRCSDDFCKTAQNKKANSNSNTAPDASLPD